VLAAIDGLVLGWMLQLAMALLVGDLWTASTSWASVIGSITEPLSE
jgi:hypothetical protein